MNMRILGIAALLVLLLAGMWMWLVRGRQSQPVAPARSTATQEHSDASSPLSVAPSPADPIRIPIEQASPAAASAESAIVNVLVVEKSTRRPMSRVQVLPRTESDTRNRYEEDRGLSRGKPWDTLRTDEQGRVVIETPPLVKLRIAAHGGRDRAGSASAEVPPLSAGGTAEIVLELATGIDMPYWLRLVEEDTGAAIAGARIVVGRKEETSPKTDAQGLAFIEGRTWSPMLLRIDSEAHAETYLVPQAGHERAEDAVLVTLPRSSILRVHVADASGQPVSDAKLDLTTEGYNLRHSRSSASPSLTSLPDPHWSARTDASGVATISRLPPRIAIRAGITSPRTWDSPDKLVLEPGETRDVEWKLTSGCDVNGILLDQENAPVRRRAMSLCKASRDKPAYFQSHSSDENIASITDDQGRFHFPNVGTGIWWVGPSQPKRNAQPSRDDVAALAQVIEVTEGQSDLDVTLRVDRGLFIRGHLLDSNGEATKGGFVHADDPAKKLSTNVNLPRDDNAFVLGPLMAGRYTLKAQGFGSDADAEPVEAEAGTDGVVLRLRPGATLHGQVLTPGDKPATSRIWITMRDSKTFGVHGTTCKKDGTFSIKGLEAGTFDLAAHTSDGAVGLLEGVEVKTAETRTGLEIKVLPGGNVRVRHEGPERYASIHVLHRGVLVNADGVERSAAREFTAPAGTVVVRADYYDEEPRFAERTVEVKAGETVDVVFEKGAH